MFRQWLRHAAVLCACGGLMVAGCSKATRPDNPQAKGIMTVLGLEYGDYLASHNDVPPKDLAAFRAFLESRPEKMTEYRVDAIDKLFTSPRDGQPITVVSGVAKPVLDAGGYALAAYETVGVDGKRLVSNVRGGVGEMTAEEFSQAYPSLGP
jgi:hypothetical protein